MQTQLAKVYLAAMDISHQSTDGKRVLNWKRPGVGQVMYALV